MDYVAVDADVTMFQGQQPVEYPPDPCWWLTEGSIFRQIIIPVSTEGYSEDV